MRFILNRVLLAFILDCASASKEDPTLATLMRAMPNRNVRSGSTAAVLHLRKSGGFTPSEPTLTWLKRSFTRRPWAATSGVAVERLPSTCGLR
jgi:hypothetical protein